MNCCPAKPEAPTTTDRSFAIRAPDELDGLNILVENTVHGGERRLPRPIPSPACAELRIRILFTSWRHGQVVRQGSAKPSFPGSNPGGASPTRPLPIARRRGASRGQLGCLKPCAL